MHQHRDEKMFVICKPDIHCDCDKTTKYNHVITLIVILCYQNCYHIAFSLNIEYNNDLTFTCICNHDLIINCKYDLII